MDAKFFHEERMLCSTGLQSDVIIEIGEMSFHLHKFPLLSRSEVLENLIGEHSSEDEKSLRCAAEYLGMSEDYGEENLITQTKIFSMKYLAAGQTPLKLLKPAKSDIRNPDGTVFWNGIRTSAKPHPVGEDWWYEDVSFLRLPLYKRLILEVGSNGMNPGKVAGALMYYAKRHLPLLGRKSSMESGNYAASRSTISATSEADQRSLLEEIVELLPDQKGVTPSNFLLRLLRTAMIIHASPSCRENLEKRVGTQLDQASLQDLLIPNSGYSVETLYDIDCVQRILDHFMLIYRDDPTSNYVEHEGQITESSHSLIPITMVANLIDSYLAEVASDVNLKLAKFQSLAAAVPDYARPIDDGIYRAIDIYLKAHPWLNDSEREQLCRLMNCQKFSLEASTHAAQNERLPLRVIVQVLFFEQLRLRTSVSGWFFVSENLDNSQNLSGNLALARERNDLHPQAGAIHGRIMVDDMKRTSFRA
ncbi:hypothetical protein POTOM_061067 [Populus tomentosa]|uniref:NPH3 domain-containing protein n=1 Tax=Populus tomentosa TaxID=118781 RepID=A0A8X8BZZ0_POPTO|nr:hypothetical protein POTOM_061067 [Populus tomentosa]